MERRAWCRACEVPPQGPWLLSKEGQLALYMLEAVCSYPSRWAEDGLSGVHRNNVISFGDQQLRHGKIHPVTEHQYPDFGTGNPVNLLTLMKLLLEAGELMRARLGP